MSVSAVIWFIPAAVSIPVAISDFRRRRVSVLALAAVFVATAAAAAYAESCRAAVRHLVAGCILAAALMTCLAAYMHLRYRGQIRLRHGFGAGDWCYMIALSPMFPPADLLTLLIASATLSLIWYRTINRRRRRTIPFAGMTAVTLTCVTVIRFCMLWLP